MKRLFTAGLTLVMAAAFLGASCARMPSNKRSANVIGHYFKKYAKKYPSTVFGQSKLKQVEVLNTQEVHKRLVSVEAFLTLQDGTVQRIFATLKDDPFWWRFISWENASN